MHDVETPCEMLTAQISSWDGVSVQQAGEQVMVMYRGHVLARFVTDDALEVALCGPIRRQVTESPEIVAEGVWPVEENKRLLMDLNQPGAVEEAIRSLLNAYIEAREASGNECFLSPDALKQDPTGSKALRTIEGYRSLIRERGYSVYPEAVRLA